MAVYSNQHLCENVAALRYLQTTPQDVAALWASVWAQVADNYERGLCTEIPGFARFGRDARGRRQAVLLPAFLKSCAARFCTDQRLDGALTYTPLDEAQVAGTRTQLAHVIAELQSRMLHHVSRMRLGLGRLAVFTFDKRLRQYTFTFAAGPAQAAVEPTCAPTPAHTAQSPARGAPQRPQSAAPALRAQPAATPTRQPARLPERPASCQPARPATRALGLRSPARSGPACPEPEAPPPATPLTAQYRRSTRPYGYDEPPEAPAEPAAPAAAPRPQSAPLGAPARVCRRCLYDEAVALKAGLAREARETERRDGAEAARLARTLHEARERADRARYASNQAANLAYNERVAADRRARERAFRLAGHHSRPGELQPNAAVLQDDPGLAARVRERSARCLSAQLAQAREAAARRDPPGARLAAFAERRRCEAAVAAEARRALEFKRRQQEALRAEIGYYARQPRAVRPLVAAPMNCEAVVGALYDGSPERAYGARHDRAQAENRRAAETARAGLRSALADSARAERSRGAETLAALERERRAQLLEKTRRQRELQRAYEQQIRERADRERREREGARQGLAAHRFRDELVPVCACGRCGRSYRYDNVFPATE